ncbi:MAG: dockerin type I domain-containing protein [bacterium]
MFRKYSKLILILVIVAILSSLAVVRYVFADTETITASVGVINPAGPTGVLTAIPEKRIPNVDDTVYNRSTSLVLRLYLAGSDRSNPDNILFETNATSSDTGVSYDLLFTSMSPSNAYDITVKGYSHLTRLISNVILGYNATLDFTYSSTVPLLSGDINMTAGDDKINALDVSILVDAWGTDNERADLNQDNEVNAIDISNLLANFNSIGD